MGSLSEEKAHRAVVCLLVSRSGKDLLPERVWAAGIVGPLRSRGLLARVGIRVAVSEAEARESNTCEPEPEKNEAQKVLLSDQSTSRDTIL